MSRQTPFNFPDEIRRMDRFSQYAVVAAYIQRVIAAGDHDHRDVSRVGMLLQFKQDVMAGNARQSKIQHDSVRRGCVDNSKGVHPVSRLPHRKSGVG